MPFWQAPNLAGLLAFHAPKRHIKQTNKQTNLLLSENFKHNTKVKDYNGIPSTHHAASVVVTFANKHDVKAGKGLEGPLACSSMGQRPQAGSQVSSLQAGSTHGELASLTIYPRLIPLCNILIAN